MFTGLRQSLSAFWNEVKEAYSQTDDTAQVSDSGSTSFFGSPGQTSNINKAAMEDHHYNAVTMHGQARSYRFTGTSSQGLAFNRRAY